MKGGRLKEKVGDLGKKTVWSDKLVYTFLRSAVSSQCAGWADMGVSFALFAWLSFSAGWSAALGAVVGGVINCLICYKFTFHARGLDWKSVGVKYTLVWVGSLVLNTFGTEITYNIIRDWDWLEDIGFKRDGYFAAARLFISLVVSWFWNFPLQRYFVFSASSFDKYARVLFPVRTSVKKSDGEF